MPKHYGSGMLRFPMKSKTCTENMLHLHSDTTRQFQIQSLIKKNTIESFTRHHDAQPTLIAAKPG
jgi:hypothetical protein